MQVALDLVLLRLRQRGDLLVQVGHAVVDVHAQLVEQLAVLFEGFLVEHAHAVAEDDGVRHLHHRGLDVQREHHAGGLRVLDLLLVEGQQGLLAHEHRVDDFAGQQRDLGLEHDGLAGLRDQLHLDVAGLVQRDRLFAVVEVAVRHVRDMGARCGAPLTHAVRMLAGEFLDGLRSAAVGIALAQHRIDRRTQHLGVTQANRLVFVGLRVLRVLGNHEAAAAQFADGSHQLVLRGADIGQLDDVGISFQRLLSQLRQGAGRLLLVVQEVGEFAKDAVGHGDVALGHFDVRSRREGAHDGQEGVGRQVRSFVRERVDDLGKVGGQGDASQKKVDRAPRGSTMRWPILRCET